MKLNVNQQAPDFQTSDVYGRSISLHALRGKNVYLAFERNAGCPVCNLRTHELLKQSDYFKEKNTTVIMVYESSVAKMAEYLGENTYPFYFVADPENVLYNKYGVERSLGKMMKAMFHGLMSKVKRGKQLFRNPIKQDGHVNRIPAEFVIDRQGRLAVAHYGDFVGDHLPLDVLRQRGGL
jgi:thioredoxin-dependent peroxiredoxin